MPQPSFRVHPTAIIESNVRIGDNTSVWDNVHVRRNTRIGSDCIVGEKTHISYDVEIGNLVKINAFVYICTAVSIEDGVMISAGCTFANDRFPRAANCEVTALRTSEPDDQTLATIVRKGATLGAGCIIGPGIEIGEFAMLGMGSVVTRSVPAYALMIGHPARCVGYVCACGEPVIRFNADQPRTEWQAQCPACGRMYEHSGAQGVRCVSLTPGSIST